MATFIKAGFWEKLCKPCKGYKGWLNLDEFVQSFIPKPTYKVFTALLTQSGGENIQYYNEGSIKIGETYLITANVAGELGEGDFTNVGAPNNLVGTHFIATGTTPNSWGTFSELELNTGAPLATVLENTIGNVWFTYSEVGNYSINSSGLFISNKTVQFINGLKIDEGVIVITNNTDEDFRYLQSTSSGGDPTDGVFISAPIEIRVYN